jgi:hypothetical protein
MVLMVSVYIQDAQLEQGLVARDYIETTTAAVEGGITDNVPRLDYTDSSCPALLLEPQRTNLVNYSEYYDLFDHNVTLTTNADTSPEGVDNASKIVVSSNSQPRIEKFNTWSNSTTYSMSAYVKADTGRYIGFGLYSPEMGNQWVRFDLTNETFTYSDTNWSNASIVDAGDDWYKISATITTDATNSSKSGFKLASMQSNSYNTGTIGDSFFVYGIQIEEGSYATSYIPTYGTSVTRNREQCSENGLSSLIGQTEGTIYWEGSFQDNSNPILIQLAPNSGNYTSTIYLEFAGSSIKIRVYDSGTQQAYFTTSASAGTQYKIALAYKENDINGYVNGSSIGTDTSATIQSGLNNVHIGELRGSSLEAFNGSLPKQVMLFKTRLSNEELADLTTL